MHMGNREVLLEVRNLDVIFGKAKVNTMRLKMSALKSIKAKHLGL